MACGALVVVLYNPANSWLLEDGVTCMIAQPTASDLAAKLFKAATSWDELGSVRAAATRNVTRLAGRGWAAELTPVVEFMMRPAGETRGRAAEGAALDTGCEGEAGLAPRFHG